MNRCVLSWQEEKKPEQGKETAAEKPQAKEEQNEVAKAQDGKKGGGGGGEGQMKEGGSEEKKGEAPPAPEEIMMRVFMHCEGCARKVKRSLKGFEGDEGSTFSLSYLDKNRILFFCCGRRGGRGDGLQDPQGGGEGEEGGDRDSWLCFRSAVS